MRFHMVNAQGWNTKRPREALGKRCANQERAHQPGSCGVGNTVDVIQRLVCVAQHPLGQWCDLSHMIARCQLGYDPAIVRMQCDLTVQGLRQQSVFAVVQRYPCFVAGAFNTKN